MQKTVCRYLVWFSLLNFNRLIFSIFSEKPILSVKPQNKKKALEWQVEKTVLKNNQDFKTLYNNLYLGGDGNDEIFQLTGGLSSILFATSTNGIVNVGIFDDFNKCSILAEILAVFGSAVVIWEIYRKMS